MSDIKVSITSLAYNQERYIEKAIESFLMQKTNFDFEILINDDCSTDNTAMIIKEYEAKYPGKVIGVYHKENQYKKGIKPGVALRKMARGEYIAFCECDDFYTDEYKLQKQVDYMDAHPECSITTHAVTTVDSDGNPNAHTVRNNRGDRDYTAGEVIALGDNNFATCSMMIRRKFDAEYPEFYYKCPVGDYPMQVYMTMCGYLHYIDEFMASYRINADSSWTNGIQTDDEKAVKTNNEMVESLRLMNEYSGGKYKKETDEKIYRYEFLTSLITHNIKGVYENYRKADKTGLSKAAKIGAYLPSVYYILRKIRTHRRRNKYKGKTPD